MGKGKRPGESPPRHPACQCLLDADDLSPTITSGNFSNSTLVHVVFRYALFGDILIVYGRL